MTFRRTRKQRGISLVDLLLTLTLAIGICAIPFVLSWAHGMQVERSTGALIQASHHARALALRHTNPIQSGGHAVVAGVKLLPNAIVLVCINDPKDSNCREGGANVEWRADLSRGMGVAVTINDQSEAIFGFDQAGELVASADFKISKGLESKTGHLY